MSSSSRYTGERRFTDTDVTIITGQFKDDQNIRVLLLMRFHHVNPQDHLSKSDINKLYKNLKALMGKNGYEHRRVGGSSGKLELSKDFYNFVNVTRHGANFPRFMKSIKFIRDKSELKWDAYYIGTKDLEAKKTFCCNIKKGGAFTMPSITMDKFPFLQDFLATKAKSAMILYELNGASDSVKIQPAAVSQEISNLKRANLFDWRFIKRHLNDICSPIDKIGSKKAFVMKYFSTMNKHTVVQHCVGFHLDQIKSQPVLENKMCFKLPIKTDCDNGRCGGGPDHFVFALLDWPKKNVVRRAVYRALGGHRFVGERVTEFNWQSFRTLFRIPEIPEDARATDEALEERINEARQIMAREQREHPHLRFE